MSLKQLNKDKEGLEANGSRKNEDAWDIPRHLELPSPQIGMMNRSSGTRINTPRLARIIIRYILMAV